MRYIRPCVVCGADVPTDARGGTAFYCHEHQGIPTHKARARSAQRRAVKFGLTKHYTGFQLNELFKFYNHRCMCCGISMSEDLCYMGFVADHVISLSLGGNNTIDNIQILCSPCNMAKRNCTIDYRLFLDEPFEEFLAHLAALEIRYDLTESSLTRDALRARIAVLEARHD